jgi:hypothetical protein
MSWRRNVELKKSDLAKEDAARKEKEDQLARIEAERLERIEKERQEREAAAEAKAQKDARNREKGERFNQVDRSTEDEVEAYYRQAAESAEKSKFTSIQQKHEDNASFREDKEADAAESQTERVENVNAQKDEWQNVFRNGEGVTLKAERQAMEDKDRASKNTKTYQEAADKKRQDEEGRVQEDKDTQAKLVNNDRIRMTSIAETESKKSNYTKQQEAYTNKSEAGRKTNIYNVEKDKDAQKDVEYDGEKVRQENMVPKVNEAKDRANEQAADVKSAADVRLESANRDVDDKKEIAASVGEGKDEIRQTRVNEINQKKEDEEMAVIDRDAKASAKAFESREDAFSKNPGREKEASEYPVIPGTEDLPQGVTETSYELPNKTVIERTVKIGNKVDRYKKVVSKFAIYYFKNDKPITENTWITETLEIGE